MQLFPKVVDHQPLVLLIDDLQATDAATLLLLRVLIQRKEITLVICATAMETQKLLDRQEATPLERFRSAHQAELGIRTVILQPLTAADIVSHLNSFFPGLNTPETCGEDLVRITQGNPLFLTELVRKLVLDQKLTLVGEGWVMRPLEQEYLPRSLEEIVLQKIAVLDQEGQQLLAQASTFGEDIPLSVLTGSADIEETKVLDFLDRAEALGLVSLDFQHNDERMHFLGKRVLEICYGAVEENRRQELHERVGNYQEGLHERRLGPSASLLAYHFKRSANQEKARHYEQMQLGYSQAIFNADEATVYSGELPDEEQEQEGQLQPDSLPLIPQLLRTTLTAVRSTQLYPPESPAILRPRADVKEALDQILTDNERLNFSQAHRVLLVNGKKLDVSEFKSLAEGFIDLLVGSELQGMTFNRGVTSKEMELLLEVLGRSKHEEFDGTFWKRFSSENRLEHVDLQQMRYVEVRRNPMTAPGGQQAATQAQAAALEPGELAELPTILRSFLGATKNVKIYPVGSLPVTRSVQQLHNTLQPILRGRPDLTLAGINQTLFANGVRIKTADFQTLADRFSQFINSIALSSVTFHSHVTTSDIETFIGALRELPKSGPDSKFWTGFAAERRLSGIALNQRHYGFRAVEVVQRLLGQAGQDAGDDDTGEGPQDRWLEQISKEPAKTLREALPSFGKELLINGEHELFRRLLRRLFKDFRSEDPQTREMTIRACRSLFDSLTVALQYRVAGLAVDFLLAALAQEEPRALREVTDLLNRMSASAVQFGDYRLSSRMLSEIAERRQRLKASQHPHAGALAKALDYELEPVVQKLLEVDMTSGDPAREERAARILGSVGSPSIPLLVDVIKHEKDRRVREIAASLLARMGTKAANQIRRELMLELTVDHRLRILEVIDTVTPHLRDELVFCLRDGDVRIRRAALRLVWRVKDDGLTDVLVPIVGHADSELAMAAIRCLASLGSPTAARAVESILNSTTTPGMAIACSKALGQIGDSGSAPVLTEVLSRRKFHLLHRRWNGEVRATAALALSKIADPGAAERLSHFKNDSDPRVRQLAQSVAAGEDPAQTAPAPSPVATMMRKSEPQVAVLIDEHAPAPAAPPDEPEPQAAVPTDEQRPISVAPPGEPKPQVAVLIDKHAPAPAAPPGEPKAQVAVPTDEQRPISVAPPREPEPQDHRADRRATTCGASRRQTAAESLDAVPTRLSPSQKTRAPLRRERGASKKKSDG